MRVIELFAGIGACSTALKRIGKEVEIVDAVEIDKYAIASFNAIHGTNFETQDITIWDKDFKDIDLITHGSPCQDFSVAGKQAGGDIGSGTRSSLMYETIRIVGKIRPKYVLWENVKNILSTKHKHNFDAYVETMKNLGYNSFYEVLNAKDYGIPQNRERVYTISIRKDIPQQFNFPEKEELLLKLKDMLEVEVDEKYYLSDDKTKGIKLNTTEGNSDNIELVGKLDIKGHDCVKRIYSKEGLSPTLTDMQGGNRQPKIVEEKEYQRAPLKFLNRNQKNIEGDYAFCVDSSNTGGIKETQNNKIRIRKLTPKECWRLMGFSDEDFERAKAVPMSNSQLYKQARKFDLRTSIRKNI